MNTDLPPTSALTPIFTTTRPLHPPKQLRWAVFLVLALLSLSLRTWRLGERPMHTDEAVNAYIVGQLLDGKPFVYDSQDRHGPLLAAVTLPLVKLQGTKTFADLTESELRLAPAITGSLTILLFGAAVELFGFLPCLIAALLFAGASLPVYYSRYFIHETLFVAATLAFLLACWRVSKRPSIGNAMLAAACAALMLAGKETAVLHFFALAAAAIVFWRRNLRGESLRSLWQPRAALAALLTLLLLSMLLFTWFGTNWKALGTLLHVASGTLARAGGEGHEKPFWYYGQLLSSGWSGGLILVLACIGLVQALRERARSGFALLAFYAIFIFAIYSLIPYKTPWLALNLWLPIVLLVGLALEALWQRLTSYHSLRLTWPLFAATIMIALITHDTRERVFLHPADESNPYAYAHTSEDLPDIIPRIERLARENNIVTPRIAVIAADPWPLPWYLRRFSQVGFWQPGQQTGAADFYITSTDESGQYSQQLQDLHPEFFGVRPNVLILLWAPAPK